MSRPLERNIEYPQHKEKKWLFFSRPLPETGTEVHPRIITDGTSYDLPIFFSMLRSDRHFRVDLRFLQKKDAKNVGANRLPKIYQTPAIFNMCSACCQIFPCVILFAGSLVFASFFTELGKAVSNNRDAKYLPYNLAVVGALCYILSFLTIFFSCIPSYRGKITNNLSKVIPKECVVIRENEDELIKVRKLVPGDRVKLGPGEYVPADLRIISTNNLTIDRSIYTAEKEDVKMLVRDSTRSERNVAYLGSYVKSGSGVGVVVKTGTNTMLAKIIKYASTERGKIGRESPLQSDVQRLTRILVWAALALAVFATGMMALLRWEDNDMNLLFYVAAGVILSMIPEGLPTSIQLALYLSYMRLKRKKILVKEYNSVETLGTTSVIIVDKTGVLTENKMKVNHIYYNDGIWDCYEEKKEDKEMYDDDEFSDESDKEEEEEEGYNLFDETARSYRALREICLLCNDSKFVIKKEEPEEKEEDVEQSEENPDSSVLEAEDEQQPEQQVEEGGEEIIEIGEDEQQQQPKEILVDEYSEEKIELLGDMTDRALLKFFTNPKKELEGQDIDAEEVVDMELEETEEMRNGSLSEEDLQSMLVDFEARRNQIWDRLSYRRKNPLACTAGKITFRPNPLEYYQISIHLEALANRRVVLVMKGAPEHVLQKCKFVCFSEDGEEDFHELDEGIVRDEDMGKDPEVLEVEKEIRMDRKNKLDPEWYTRIIHSSNHLSRKGERVIACARKIYRVVHEDDVDFELEEEDSDSDDDEQEEEGTKEKKRKRIRIPKLKFGANEFFDNEYLSRHVRIPPEDMTFVGLVGLADPPIETARPSIERLRKAGIRVMMVTGDSTQQALEVAKKVGIVAEHNRELEQIKAQVIQEDEVWIDYQVELMDKKTEEDWKDPEMKKREEEKIREEKEKERLLKKESMEILNKKSSPGSSGMFSLVPSTLQFRRTESFVIDLLRKEEMKKMSSLSSEEEIVIPGGEKEKDKKDVVVNLRRPTPKSILTEHIAILNGEEAIGAENWEEELKKDEVVFGRTSPDQKLEIVRALRRQGDVVAITGDGARDAASLREADIGIAWTDTGSQISKNAADVILGDHRLETIVIGVEEGRIVFENLKNSLAFSLTTIVPLVLSFLMFALFFIPVPISIVLVMCIHLGTDIIPMFSFAFENSKRSSQVEREYVDEIMTKRKPRDPKKDKLLSLVLIGFSCFVIGILQSFGVFFVYFVIMAENGFTVWNLWYKGYEHFFMLRHTENEVMLERPFRDSYGYERDWEDQIHALKVAQSTVFVGLVISQLVNYYIMRSPVKSIFQKNLLFSNPRVMAGISINLCFCLFVIYVPGVNEYVFGTRPILWYHWILACVFAVVMLVFDEFRKVLIRVSGGGSWLESHTRF